MHCIRHARTVCVLILKGSEGADAHAAQEVPALLSLPQGTVGSPIWLIMTGITTGIQGYNRLISKIVPLTAAARSIDLIPFMVVGHPLPCLSLFAHSSLHEGKTSGQHLEIFSKDLGQLNDVHWVRFRRETRVHGV